MRIALISAEAEFSSRLRDLLEEHGFRVDIFPTAAKGLQALAQEQAALAVLDETSPAEGGYEILRRLRAVSRIPVLMMLRWDTPEERIASLEAGADDCIGRPFHPRELVARVRSILRRSRPTLENGGAKIITANDVLVDLASREVFENGKPVSVTTVEFDILVVLMRSAGRPVSRDELMETLYRRKATPFDRSVDMHVSHLRRKLGRRPDLIKTVRGEGYQFCLANQDELNRSAS